MRRAVTFGLAAALGLVTGAFAVLAAQGGSGAPPPPGQQATAEAGTGDPAAVEPAAAPVPPERVLLAWSSGGLPGDFAARAEALDAVVTVTVVRGELLGLARSWDGAGQPVDTPPDGYVIPLDTIAVDPAGYAGFVPKSAAAAFAGLAPGEALLGRTSAELRRLTSGAAVQLADGTRLVVAGVVEDTLVGAAELIVTTADAERLGLVTPRYLLLSYQGERAAVEEDLRGLVADRALRLRGPGETPYLRHGDAVLPQALLKQVFGEFAYRRASGLRLVLDPAWVEQHIVVADVPILGRVRCHRALVPLLVGAMGELQRRNLSWLVDPEGFAGCFNPRLIAAGGGVSRHTWGAAVDLNWPKNPVGQASAQDPRLVEVMEAWGFAWGGPWLVPDPAHFEYVRPPVGRTASGPS